MAVLTQPSPLAAFDQVEFPRAGLAGDAAGDRRGPGGRPREAGGAAGGHRRRAAPHRRPRAGAALLHPGSVLVHRSPGHVPSCMMWMIPSWAVPFLGYAASARHVCSVAATATEEHCKGTAACPAQCQQVVLRRCCESLVGGVSAQPKEKRLVLPLENIHTCAHR